jgi:hypothetical protein
MEKRVQDSLRKVDSNLNVINTDHVAFSQNVKEKKNP